MLAIDLRINPYEHRCQKEDYLVPEGELVRL
jgi:hypothetical protein